MAVALIHDIFPNPFAAGIIIDPVVLAFKDGLVARLAEAAYEHRHLPDGTLDLTRLAVLADACEEAGADHYVLAHLRGPGKHWRGCHVLDWLLKKE